MGSERLEFLGYPRPDGSVGVRNYVLVIPTGLVAAKICAFVPGTRTIITTEQGGGMTARDRETVARTLIGLGRNPNVAAVIIEGGDPTGGYPELRTDRLANEIGASGKRVALLDAAAEGGTLETITKGVKVAREMVYEASKVRREPFGLDKLTLGVKCGGSDPTSGMVGNPAVGYLVDRIVDEGGTTMFGETTEVIGAEHILAKRVASPAVAQKLVERVRAVEGRALASGEDIRTVNPVPSNIAAGISTLEEKSLGAIHKSGTRPIQGVLDYAERPAGQGLYFVDNWMNMLSIFTGYAAAGTQLAIFQLGGGGISGQSVLTGSPAAIAPRLFTSANPITLSRTGFDLDFYSGTVIEGRETPEEAGERLIRIVLEIASGTMTRSETVDYQDPTQIYTLDPVF